MFCKVLLAMLGLCFAFEMKCPEPAQWPIRARLHCPNPSLYYCLLSIDGISRINVENCSKADFEAPGKRMVIRWNFDAFYCTNDRHQPIKYWTNVSSDCLFLTSTCREEGQLLHSIDKYHEYDTSCRCDYNNRYDFITRPMNPRFCIPSEEDCSCYKKKCSLVNSTLPQDYKCTEEMQKGVEEVSAVSNITRFGTSDVIFTMYPEDKNNDHVHKGNNANIHAVFAVFVIITVTTSIFVMLICCGIEIDVLLDEYCRKVYFITQLKVTTGCIEGENQTLECRLSRSNMTVYWTKQNESLQPPHYITEQTGEMYRLIIQNVNPNDEGQYFIKGKDFISSLHLRVKEYFTHNMEQTIECVEGDNVELSCAVLEDNVPAVWKKDGVVIHQSVKIEVIGSMHKLSIKEAGLRDAGNYTVIIKNRKRSTLLHVKEYFTRNMEKTMECVEGDNVELSCAVLEDNVRAVWKKDGVIQQSSRIEAIGSIHKFTIIGADRKDAGKYTVEIKNRIRSASLKVKEIPAAIRQLSGEDKDLYLEIIERGTETRYYIRILIIGENGVGKTCLLRRLLGESIDDVESTDGVDIVHRCKIRLGDGHWIIDGVADKRKAILSRIRRALKSNTADDIHIQQKMYGRIEPPTTSRKTIVEREIQYQEGKPNISEDIRIEEKLNSQSDKLVESSQYKQKNPKESRKAIKLMEKNAFNATEIIEPTSVNEREALIEKPFSLVAAASQNRNTFSQSNLLQEKENKTETELEKILTDTVLNELSAILNDVWKLDSLDEVFVDCGFWDFAGERQYYATHPIFLNPNSVHLLVANIMKDIKQINTADGFDKIGEYVDFWFDSVHSCRDMETKTKNAKGNINPPVIVVCTGIDNCKDNVEERKKIFRQQLISLLYNEDKMKHLRRICWVSNKEPADKDFDYLRKSIFELGKEINTLGEKLPLKWIQLERLLDLLRESGINILSWPDIIDLSSKCSIYDEKEIILFLKYQHKVGSIIYFESLNEKIILNQKWLADAFRCLVSDKIESDLTLTPEWKMLEEFGKLEPVLIDQLFQKDPQLEFYKHQSHLLNVMEFFGIIVKVITMLGDGQTEKSSTYYLPCMISKQTSIVEIAKEFRVKEDNCKRTPWLCVEFEFMPLDFFNHILCYYISKYPICTRPSTKHAAIYHGIGIFYLDKTKLRKCIICFSKNTIAIQLWHWDKIEQAFYKSMMEELKSVILSVKNKYEPRQVSYNLKLKCSDGNIHNPDDRLSYAKLVEFGDKDYFCEDHNTNHNTKDFFQTWFADYSEVELNMSKPTFQGTLTMTTSQLKQKFLCCSGCSNEYDEQENFARLLPCLHSLCNQCLHNLSEDGSVVCPECEQNHDINGESTCLPRDKTRQDLMDFIKVKMTPGEILCQACRKNKQAKLWCENSSEFLCDDCQVAQMRTNNSHVMLELEKLRTRANLDIFHHQQICRDHQRDLKLYCNKEECRKPICFMCTLLNHRKEDGHYIQDVLEIAGQKKDEMHKLINDVKSTGEDVKKVTELINREVQNVRNLGYEVRTEIDNTFVQFLQILEKRRYELKKEVNQYVKIKTNILEDQVLSLKQQQRYIHEASEFADHSLMSTASVFLLIEGTIMSRLDRLNQQWCKQEPYEVATIGFIHDRLSQELENKVTTMAKVWTSNAYHRNTKITNKQSEAVQNESLTFTGILSNYNGKTLVEDVSQLKATITDPDGTTFDAQVYQNGSEEFRVTFVPFQAGRYKLEVSILGKPMGLHEFQVKPRDKPQGSNIDPSHLDGATRQDFTLERKKAHRDVTVTPDGKTFINSPSGTLMESTKDRLHKFKGTFGNSPFTAPGKYYYELNVRYKIRNQLEKSNLVFEIGIARRNEMDKKHVVDGQPHAWSMICSQHVDCDAICLHIARAGKCLFHETLSKNDIGSTMEKTFGFLLDTSAGVWTIFDAIKSKPICRMDGLDCFEPLVPVVSGYNPNQVEVTMTVCGDDEE